MAKMKKLEPLDGSEVAKNVVKLIADVIPPEQKEVGLFNIFIK